MSDDPGAVNRRVWSGAGDRLVAAYAHRPLRPVEEVLLDRWSAELRGRVLEIGVGGGQLTERLLAGGADLTGIDVSSAMVEHCRGRFPQATFVVADLEDLSGFADGGFDALLAGYNVLDVLDDPERHAALEGWARVLARGGLLVYSSHNLAHADRIPEPWQVLSRHPRRMAGNVIRLRRRLRNRRRLRALERTVPGGALLNDQAHDYGLLHYYTLPEQAQRQLADHGFELLECLDLAGDAVVSGEQAAACPELHYVARRVSA